MCRHKISDEPNVKIWFSKQKRLGLSAVTSAHFYMALFKAVCKWNHCNFCDDNKLTYYLSDVCCCCCCKSRQLLLYIACLRWSECCWCSCRDHLSLKGWTKRWICNFDLMYPVSSLNWSSVGVCVLQIFIGYIIKQFEFIEQGQMR